MGKDDQTDPDREAILARRRRFIALAISGLATGACKTPPQPCLNMVVPEGGEGGEGDEGAEPSTGGPIVEDPGQPVDDGSNAEGDTSGTEAETGEPPAEPPPQPCLRVKPKPQPCLMIMKRDA